MGGGPRRPMGYDPRMTPAPHPLRRAPALQQLAWLVGLVLPAGAAAGGMSLITDHLGGYVLRARQHSSFRIMTWNVGKLYLRWESRAADQDLEHVAAVIEQLDPQVVALQELRGEEQLQQLLSLLGPGWQGKVPADIYDRRAGLLARLPADFVELQTTSGRVAPAAVVRWRDRRPLVVVSVHLDAFDPARRLRQVEELLAGAKRLGADELFLAGDFNFDPAVAANQSLDQQLYRLLTSELVDAAKYAGLTTVFSRRLDYVFFRGTHIKSVSTSVVHDRRINLMDHDPVLAEFTL